MLPLIKRLVKDERGTVIVVIAVIFTILLGFVALSVDTGILFMHNSRLGRAMDAAALAGAQELPDRDKARLAALDYASKNNIDPGTLNISFSVDNKQITLSGTRNVGLVFARFLGFETSDVNARAVAEIQPISISKGLLPVGISEDQLPLTEGVEYMLKGGAQDANPWRGILQYPGCVGAADFRKLAREGYTENVKIGDTEGKEVGDKAGPTLQGISDRLETCTHGCTWDHYTEGCLRICLVPIYRDIGESVIIVGFASVFVERVDGVGNESRLWARYINHTMSGETDDSITNSFLNSVRLVE
ncbi:MAG: pilus assembly protein TadG-related protein [Eubacteriales bacterium]